MLTQLRVEALRLTPINITFCEIKGRVYADTGSSYSVVGERMYQVFMDKGLLFQETTLAMISADGQQTTGEAFTIQMMVEIEGRSVLTKFITLPKAKGNRTLLGTDCLSSAGLVLDLKMACWYFWDNPTHEYPFGEELDIPSIAEISSNTCQFRDEEGESLFFAQKEKLILLLAFFQNVFEPGGKATNILEHHINTGNSPPISVPTYRMSPVKKEILRKEIEDLLKKGIIEECESPYGAPVVLIPKPNNRFHLCIDYWKLNEVTVPDTYPLPRMDDLLQEAKNTAYIYLSKTNGYFQMRITCTCVLR
ncbi:retrovirus-related Pol polyprotein from transposon 297 [Trichonephila clavipes]|nr:retrovirus-related Pol polyprotein from transposon 297 [Trichonephila clavipes]